MNYYMLGFKLTGTLEACEGCARSKAKARAVRNKTYTRATNLVERIFMDTTGPFPLSLIGGRSWIGVVNDYIYYSRGFFTNTKSHLPEKIE